MKGSFVKKVVTLIIAGVVLVNTSLTSLNLHFCGGSIAGIALFDCDTQKRPSCCVIPSKLSTDTDCCQNKGISFYWDADLVSLTTSQDNQESIELAWLNPEYESNLVHRISSIPTLEFTPLPALEENYQVLFQQFLL